jgi:hypothetical protein
MDCDHEKGWKCIKCHPELWTMTDDELLAVNFRIVQNLVVNLLNWKRAYYYPQHPEVNKDDVVSDVRYDYYEAALKNQYPDHPVLQMVGYSEDDRRKCVEYFRDLFGMT